MTDVLQFAASSSATPSSAPQPNRGSPSSAVAGESGGSAAVRCEVKERDKQSRDQLSLLALLIDIFRKSWVSCKSDRRELCAMEIGWPTNVRHVAHVTFDRFHGFLGLPVEFEPEVPRRAPSASAHVFGVSTESMQLSFDSRGNSVPTILLLMQRHLYAQGGLQVEGIFRINAENSQEEYVRGQLNRGVVPEGIHIHCLAGLIKAWFRELPIGILDSLSPEQVMQCQTEEQCSELVRSLPPTEAALLDWAINLMADVVQQEHLNKMNARNIAMVFAPNMTKMADPLTALMYAVQVMNFLKTLVLKALRERQNSVLEPVPASCVEPSDESGHQSPSHPCLEDTAQDDEDIEQAFIAEEPSTKSLHDCNQGSHGMEGENCSSLNYFEKLVPDENGGSFDTRVEAGEVNGPNGVVHRNNAGKNKIGQSSSSGLKRGPRLNGQEPVVLIEGTVEKTKGIGGLSCLDSRTERIEAWR